MYTAHKDALFRIPWFERCLNSGFQEGDTNIIEMPEESVAAVEQILHYAYRGNLQQVNVAPGDHVAYAAFIKTLVDTYILADKWCMEELGNDLVDQLRLAYQDWQVHWCHVTQLRESGLIDSQMRKVMLQQLASRIRRKGWAKYLQAQSDGGATVMEWCRKGGDDVVDLLRIGLTTEPVLAPSIDLSPCNWHRHDTTPKCSPTAAADNVSPSKKRVKAKH